MRCEQVWNKGSLGEKGLLVSQLPPPPPKSGDGSGGDGDVTAAVASAEPPPPPIHASLATGECLHVTSFNLTDPVCAWPLTSR